MSDGQSSKYFKYAIGEILLVVIGILIALQINNWNETRKLKKQEISVLQNLKDDIALDTIDIQFNIDYHNNFLKAEKQLLRFLESDLEQPDEIIDYDDALEIPLIISFHRSAFNNLQNSQTGIITNSELQKDISRFYDFFQNSISFIENELGSYQTYNAKLPYFKKYFKLSKQSYGIVTNEENTADYSSTTSQKAALELADVNGAKNDNGFKIELNESIFKRQVLIGFYEDMMQRIRALIQAIDQEIQQNQ